MSTPSNSKRVVIVTGGSRGIGAAVARLFGRRGWHVGLSYTKRDDGARAVAADVEAAGARAHIYRCDVRAEADILTMFAAIDRDFGRLDALVNNAGVTGPRSRLEDLPVEVLREVCETDLMGPILCAREAVRRMSTRRGGNGGAIVNISSTATRLGSPNQWVHYAAVKGAIDVFTAGLAREVGAEGIRVNAVSPGLVLNDPARETEILARLEQMRHEIPLARVGQPAEVAEAVHWLCTESAAYVTGAILPVAGGR
ncbi:MAG: SDR family oxidoreductase [Proteobacteria bacterium]|nr:SDR family oxidoreductase [Pseudomonadota bacterium]